MRSRKEESNFSVHVCNDREELSTLLFFPDKVTTAHCNPKVSIHFLKLLTTMKNDVVIFKNGKVYLVKRK